MKKLLISFLLLFSVLLYAETNTTPKSEDNETAKKLREKQQVKEQMEREEKYAKEKKFYQGDEYNLSSSEVNPNSLPSVPALIPDYDFSMDDVY
ncbi:MAG: hypothetical protein U9O24_10075 [Campylobacterota bacterium]|nr:hypothetical protein [Campylobacterota bacterium]